MKYILAIHIYDMNVGFKLSEFKFYLKYMVNTLNKYFIYLKTISVFLAIDVNFECKT